LISHRRTWPGAKEIPVAEEGLLPSFGTTLQIGRTFALVCVGWILFRAESLSDAFGIIAGIGQGLLSSAFYRDLLEWFGGRWGPLILLLCFVLAEWCGRVRWNPLPVAQWPLVVRWTAYSLIAWSLVLFGTRHVAEFIYFQF